MPSATNKKYFGLLVGQYFRPPARLLLAALPTGAALILEPEPDNAYDEHAVQVLVDPEELDETKYGWLEQELPGTGFNLGEILAYGPRHLGYLARQGNKSLEKVNAFPNQAILDLIGNGELVGKLRWGPNGEALVEVERENE